MQIFTFFRLLSQRPPTPRPTDDSIPETPLSGSGEMRALVTSNDNKRCVVRSNRNLDNFRFSLKSISFKRRCTPTACRCTARHWLPTTLSAWAWAATVVSATANKCFWYAFQHCFRRKITVF